VALRLRNQNDPEKVLILTMDAWFGMLDQAEEFGWNPMGTVLPGLWSSPETDLYGYDIRVNGRENGHHGNGRHLDGRRLVLFEDALNLADALEAAFLEYEPISLPASFFYFEPRDPALNRGPGIGAIVELIDFCRTGAFWIEHYQRSFKPDPD
jgi:hypothetical protein